ncbi:unnamed protein product [Amoebophrya sp. A25]|nr:unnamed protein product [Amoebophrya sp. A25]|eukprot:GSA25T00023582001.1
MYISQTLRVIMTATVTTQPQRNELESRAIPSWQKEAPTVHKGKSIIKDDPEAARLLCEDVLRAGLNDNMLAEDDDAFATSPQQATTLQIEDLPVAREAARNTSVNSRRNLPAGCTREGYLHKRAGFLRWTVRYFRLDARGVLCWWRPTFAEQVRLQRPACLNEGQSPNTAVASSGGTTSSGAPSASSGAKSKPVRALLVAEARAIEIRAASFPFSTRVVIKWPDYTLELRAEREPAIRDWYEKLLAVWNAALKDPG